MSVRQQRSKTIAGRIPYPELPLPAKYQKIRKAPPEEPVLKIEPKPKAEPKPKPKRLKSKPIASIEIPEPIIGGELEPEPPKKRDEGDHVIEEIDFADYQ
jgi:hypothetical protein